MKKYLVKGMAAVLCVSLAVGTGVTYHVNASKSDDEKNTGLTSLISKKDYTADTFQKETVYVLSDSDGNPGKVIVSDSFRNNLTGEETASQKVSDTEVPVKVSVSYELDGREVNASEIAGKSGHVKIIYEYENTRTESVKINGADETIYVPFAAVTGLILDNESFSNVTVEGGRAIDDGSRQLIVGVGLPGLAESIDPEEKYISPDDIPNRLVIEADTDSFELGTVYTLVTNFDLSSIEMDGDSIKDSVNDALASASDAFAQLLDGSEQLAEGLGTASDGAKALAEGADAACTGITELGKGADQLHTSTGTLRSGVSDIYDGSKQLSDAAGTLSLGLQTITANNETLTAGAKQVFESLLATTASGLKDAGLEVPALTIENYAAVLDSAAEGLKATDPETLARAQVEAAVEANRSAIKAQVTAAVAAQLGVDATSSVLESDQVRATIEAKTEETIAALVEQNMASDEVRAQIAAGNSRISAGVAGIEGAKKSLDDYNTFYQGIVSYTSGVSTAAAGAGQLKEGADALTSGLGEVKAGTKALEDGTASLSEGVQTLAEGIGLLAENEKELSDGIADLKDGADKLHEGIETINTELVGKISDMIDENLNGITDRLEAIKKASGDYKCLESLNEAEDGSVKFIYKTGEIKAGD